MHLTRRRLVQRNPLDLRLNAACQRQIPRPDVRQLRLTQWGFGNCVSRNPTRWLVGALLRRPISGRGVVRSDVRRWLVPLVPRRFGHSSGR